MRYRKLDPDGDYTFGHGADDFYQDQAEAVAQAVKTRLALWQGEWMLDTGAGMPWRTGVLGKYTAPVHDMAIRQSMIDTPGVRTLDSYTSRFDPQSRRLTVQASLTTAYGPIAVSTTL